jgi:hypothetical protein
VLKASGGLEKEGTIEAERFLLNLNILSSHTTKLELLENTLTPDLPLDLN